MNILIAGASGSIGTRLVQSLQPEHKITVLGRELATLEKKFPEVCEHATWENLSELDASKFNAVINLCGYNIAQTRWTKEVKKNLISSRVETNKKLINWLISKGAKPHYLSANAVGIYGLQPNGSSTTFDENTVIDFEHPSDFLSEIGIAWQRVLTPAIDYGMAVTSLRFGVVLQQSSGMLKKLKLSFYSGLGSVLGDGEQIISWIHIDDLVASIIFLLNNPQLTGAFNITAPNPVSQREFSLTLASTLKRPLFLKTPGFIIKLLLGEMGESLLLKGQRVIPKRLQDLGFQFKYPELSQALSQEFK